MPAGFINVAAGFGWAIAPALTAMTVFTVIELLIPLHPRSGLNDRHLGPNLTLIFLAFLTNFAFNTAMLAVLVWLQAAHFGVLRHVPLWPLAIPLVAIVALDFSTYIAHVSMHKIPALWRFHSIHHSDRALDVTTTIRQHPGESVIRYFYMSVAAVALGVTPGAFVAYRLTSSMIGLMEHANIALPLWLDTALSWVTASPNMHKVHHSRSLRYTDSNYGNILSLWDRVFLTFTPARIGTDIDYGLDGFDEPAKQTTLGLLALPTGDKTFGRATAQVRR
jgi:sterol desaturase/sphingolipid hydroxylase (fatty acid hydroxylase superfamily)